MNSISELKKQAGAKDVSAMLALGKALLKGDGVKADPKNARKWLTKASKAGERDADCYLAFAEAKGIGCKPDVKKAAQICKDAADDGNYLARCMIGVCGKYAIGIERDAYMSDKRLKEASEDERDVCAAFEITLDDEAKAVKDAAEGVSRESLKPIFDKIVASYESLATKGFVKAQFVLGLKYLEGDIVRRDDNKAFEWFKRAADNGSDDGVYAVAYCYDNGIGIQQDYFKAYDEYRLAVKSGNADAEARLGYFTLYGFGTERDIKGGYEIITRCAAAGNAQAQLYNAICQKEGLGCKKDVGKALETFKSAEQNGCVGAYLQIAELCDPRRGYFTKADAAKKEELKKTAAEYYVKAAEAGYAEATLAAATSFGDGAFTEVDVDKKVKLLEKAIEAGEADALYELSRCYESGEGVERSVAYAEELLNEAAQNGSVSACKDIIANIRAKEGKKSRSQRLKDAEAMLAEAGDISLYGSTALNCEAAGRVGETLYWSGKLYFETADEAQRKRAFAKVDDYAKDVNGAWGTKKAVEKINKAAAKGVGKASKSVKASKARKSDKIEDGEARQ